jgi:type IV secretory pathway protease TraF
MVMGTGNDTPEMGKDDNSKTRVKRLRWFALGCLAGVALLWAMCQAGLRINGTHSEPVGIYWAVSKPAAKGDLVFVEPPAEPIFRLAKERGYLATLTEWQTGRRKTTAQKK